MKEIIYNIDDKSSSFLHSINTINRMITSFIYQYSVNNNFKKIITNSSICSFLQYAEIYYPVEVKILDQKLLHVGILYNINVYIDLTINNSDKIIKLIPDVRKNKIKLLSDEKIQDIIQIKFIDNYNIL